MSSESITLPSRITGLPEGAILNPFQELIVPYLKTDEHMIIQAHTGAGKTVAFQMLCYRWLKAGKKVVYIAITKALAEQKHRDWTNPKHPWIKYRTAILTGDHSEDPTLNARLLAADIIIATPEAMLSRFWKNSASKNVWLNDVHVLGIDEIHLCGEGSRGSTMEVLAIEMMRVNPQARLIGLSGTLKNYKHFIRWWKNLTGEKPDFVASDFRPVPITRIYHELENPHNPDEVYRRVRSIAEGYAGDQMLIACFNKYKQKKWNEQAVADGLDSQAYNADLPFAQRIEIEETFLNRMLRLLWATSGLFTGVNLPAKHVIATNVSLSNNSPLPAVTILQALGRAGRYGFDTIGYQHVFIPTGAEGAMHKKRIDEGEDILSQLADERILATHFLGAIYCGAIYDMDSGVEWLTRTLYWVQLRAKEKAHGVEALPQAEELITRVAGQMRGCRMLLKPAFEEDPPRYALSKVGKICAQLLLDPYHYADLLNNFDKVTEENLTTIDFAVAVGSCAEYRQSWFNKRDKHLIPEVVKRRVEENYWTPVTCVYNILRGDQIPGHWKTLSYQITSDVSRWVNGLSRAMNEGRRCVELPRMEVAAHFAKLMRGHQTMSVIRTNLGAFRDYEVLPLVAQDVLSVSEARRNLHKIGNILTTERRISLGIVSGGGFRASSRVAGSNNRDDKMAGFSKRRAKFQGFKR